MFWAAVVLSSVSCWAVANARAADAGGSSGVMPADKAAKSDKKAEKKPAAAKLYRVKSKKEMTLEGKPVTSLSMEDLNSGRTETMYVPAPAAAPAAEPEQKPAPTEPAPEPAPAEGTDPAAAPAAPPSTAEFVKNLVAGTAVEVTTQREKGRTLIASISKANLAPGEERPNVYVLVGWDKKKTDDGKAVMGVKLKKFGKETMFMVPLTRDAHTKEWMAPWGVDDVVNKVSAGASVEAKVKPGNPPQLLDLVQYRPPERGTFVGLKETEVNGAVAAAFQFTAGDGITLTISLPGVEQSIGKGKGGGQNYGKKAPAPPSDEPTKILRPDPAMLEAVRRIKPGSEVEVMLQPGDSYILREIKVLSKPSATDSKKSS
jgi:hypothetical protein